MLTALQLIAQSNTVVVKGEIHMWLLYIYTETNINYTHTSGNHEQHFFHEHTSTVYCSKVFSVNIEIDLFKLMLPEEQPFAQDTPIPLCLRTLLKSISLQLLLNTLESFQQDFPLCYCFPYLGVTIIICFLKAKRLLHSTKWLCSLLWVENATKNNINKIPAKTSTTTTTKNPRKCMPEENKGNLTAIFRLPHESKC